MEKTPPELSDPASDANQDASTGKSGCGTLGGLFRRLALPIRPRVLAYLCGLLFVVILGYLETRRWEAVEEAIPPLGPSSMIAPERAQVQSDPDGIKWVIYAQNACDEGTVRINRWTHTDGYPEGRLVAWSSPPLWWLEGLGYLRHMASGEDLKTAIAEVSPHYNTYLWIFAAATMGLMCIFAYGWRGAAIVPALFASLFLSKYGLYSPDHHLWMLLAAVGTLVCLSAPFYAPRPSTERFWFVGAAFFCAFGLWISAATQAIALIGIFAGFLFVPTDAAKKVDSANWRLFGIVASILTMGAYAFEFLPEMTVRVEANNPVYAAGVLVAGIWFWQMHDFAASGRRWDSLDARPLVYSALLMLIVAAPVIVYLPYCFSLEDPFFARWEAQISEEQPLDIFSFVTSMHGFLFAAAAAALAGIAVNWKSKSAGFGAALAILAGFVAVQSYFGFAHNRFSETLLGCAAVAVCWGLPVSRRDIAGWFAAAFLALLCVGALNRSKALTYSTVIGGVPENCAYSLNVRNAGDSLLRISKGCAGPVLAPSNEGTLLNYYTKYPVYGTAYWENRERLYYLNSILFEEMPEGEKGWKAVGARLASGGAKYVVIPKNFGYDSSYMIYDQQRLIDPSHCFAYYLIHTDKDKFVPWLTLEKDDEKFRIFTVHLNGAGSTAGHEKGNGK